MLICVIYVVCEGNGGDSEIDEASKAAGDAHVIDVTGEFVGSQGIIDVSACETECRPSPEPVPHDSDATCSQQAETEVGGLNEAVDSLCVTDDLEACSSRDVEIAVVLGGMDTGGEIFDDCLVFNLTM